MARKRPAQPTAPKKEDPKTGEPKDWDDKKDAEKGPEYRAAFLGSRQRTVQGLEEELKRVKADTQRAEKRLSKLKQTLQVIEKDLARTPESPPSAIQRRHQAAATTGAGAGAAAQVCAVCGVPLPEAKYRFCYACLPGILDEAAALQEELGPMLLERAKLQRQLERDHETAQGLQATEEKLAARLLAHDPQAEKEKVAGVLDMLAQLQAVQTDDEASKARDAERLDLLYSREQEAAARCFEAAARRSEAETRNRDLKERLEAANERMAALLDASLKLPIVTRS